MTWASKRQAIYLGGVILFFLVIGFWIGYPHLKANPTCFDFRQNGDETGVDCGGSCQRACVFEVDQLSVVWTRIFPVAGGRYNAVAYLENQNKNEAVPSVRYRFRFADEDNVYLGSREGKTPIPPAGKFAIFEPAIDLGHAVPVYASFEFLEVPHWIKVDQGKINQLKISISGVRLNDTDSKPRMSATIKNNSLFTIPDINFVTILYDKIGNAVNVSSTYLDFLRAEESKVLNYTWPYPFDREVVVREIIPIYDIFKAEFR